MKKSADKLMDLVMYLFMFYYSYTVHYFYHSRKKKLKMANGGELYVELWQNRILHKTQVSPWNLKYDRLNFIISNLRCIHIT